MNYARGKEGADAVVARITAAGGNAVAVQTDISQPAAIPGLFDAAVKAFGHVDILVNNAGVYEFGGLDSVTPESFDRMYAINVRGLVLATQAAIRLFPAEGGVVINISSGVAKTPMTQAQAYSSTKGAVDVLTRGLALELGPLNIRVVGIAPGLTATDGTAGMDQQTIDFVISRTPLGRIGTTADIAAAVSFVASGDGGWITGETIQVGGGLMF